MSSTPFIGKVCTNGIPLFIASVLVSPPGFVNNTSQASISKGMKIYFYRTMTLVIDDSFVTIGSTNIDFRGFEQDFEINAFMYDSDLAVQQRNIFIRDLEDCEEVIPEEWEKRPRIEKAKESFARIFSQVL